MSFALLLAAAVALSLLMAFAWAVQRRTGQSGWIDTIWSFSVGLVALGGLLAAGPLEGRRLAAFALVLCWSIRLGAHIASRTHGAGDDPRYAALMKEWGPSAPRELFLFLQYQAIAGFVLVLAVLLAGNGPAPFGGWMDIAILALALMALVGEAVADAQLAAWKRLGVKGGVCDVGLWAWSRHPNYFCEWLFWLSIALLALAGGGWTHGLALLAPVMMYALLVHASGIPHLEAHMMRTRPELFAAYKARTPVFFPFRLPGEK